MRTRDKFLIAFLILVGFASVYGRILDNQSSILNDPVNAGIALILNVVGWYLIIKLCFWIYDHTIEKKKSR